jgi:ESS family glutamate:Na+ symporter
MAIASLALLLGVHVRKRSIVLEHFCLPVALIGGIFVILARVFLYYFLNTEVTFDISMLPYFFLAFFATIGFNASISLIKHGGKILLYCTAACWGISVIQNIVGVVLSYFLGIDPVLGVLAGAVSLAGGHGAAIAFGSLVESNGIIGAEAFGVAAATFGVLAGSAIGAPLAEYLITRHHLKIETTHDHVYSHHFDDEVKKGSIDPTRFVRMLAILLVCMAFGSWIVEWFNILLKNSQIIFLKNFKFPDYVWTMLLAVFMRNAGDAVNIFKRCADSLGLILSLSLRYAVVIVVMNLRITELRNVAIPLMIILFIQTAVVVLIAVYGLFTPFGRDYDAAVICAGLCGLMLGAPHSAMSNISSVCEQHEKVYSHKALLVVSLCGAALVDIFIMPFSSVCISMLL